MSGSPLPDTDVSDTKTAAALENIMFDSRAAYVIVICPRQVDLHAQTYLCLHAVKCTCDNGDPGESAAAQHGAFHQHQRCHILPCAPSEIV